ncbi:MAG: biotin synthase BioB [Candidatus Omnitrophica bacterium CG11_big_fil_rev_8_21_14_0_20_42_13]|uniref:Biotin synthase n=1 Tax=Candidatus Ghiorseimicrobium undicola TaxID=1974746 RepID=A0A2H0LY71_9BACT|nr:MAG: biotin synthase BioB [Candidatus Omnitrophica bacterium CG11_big_fil_rev_8_21_14_0_20_42_13]
MLNGLKNKVLKGENLSFQEAEQLYSLPEEYLTDILSASSKIRTKYRHDAVSLCAITNARSGMCPEDCAFCAQSGYHNTSISTYPLISKDEMLNRAGDTFRQGTNRFCIVTSGRGINNDELSVICEAIGEIKRLYPNLKIDASLGILSEKDASKLKKCGLDRYNHNLESAESYFSKICTTHTYADRLRTAKIIKKAGIELCCGGIIGLGETDRQRIEFAFALKDLDIDSLPLNFLNPIANTQMMNFLPLRPLSILKTIALFRFILPTKEIRICGGRQVNLRNLQPLIFMAGADAIIIGNYLTTPGSRPQDDIQMIQDLGLRVISRG